MNKWVFSVAFVLTLILQAAPVSAHSAATWYPDKWELVGPIVVHWHLSPSWPNTSNWNARPVDATKVWNNRVQTIQFRQGTRLAVEEDPLRCELSGKNTLHYWNFPDPPNVDVLGATNVCVLTALGSGRIVGFTLSIDNEHIWWASSSTAIPGREYDLLGVLIHEFDHGVGFTPHWDQGGAANLCPTDSTRHTMCASIWSGVTYWRTIESHDAHTFDGAY